MAPKNMSLAEIDRVFVRSVEERFKLTPGEAMDVKVIADQWECSKADVLWYCVAKYLASCRSRKLIDLPYSHKNLSVARLGMAFDLEDRRNDPGIEEGEELSEGGEDSAVSGAPGLESA